MGFFSSEISFLGDGETYARMGDIVRKATDELIIVSPYAKPTDDFVREIEARRREGVSVDLRLRHDELSKYQAESWFSRLMAAGVVISSVVRLHSKLYINEQWALITSMNFMTTSGENSHEAGVLVEAGHEVYDQAREYLEKMAESPDFRPATSGTNRKWTRKPKTARSTSTGFCIRCATSIPLNKERPYCAPHYEAWAKYKNDNYEDQHCHSCGKEYSATMRRPACNQCFTRA